MIGLPKRKREKASSIAHKTAGVIVSEKLLAATSLDITNWKEQGKKYCNKHDKQTQLSK